jgi:hypothetical protein
MGIVRIDCDGCGDCWTGPGQKAKLMLISTRDLGRVELRHRWGIQLSTLQPNSIFAALSKAANFPSVVEK